MSFSMSASRRLFCSAASGGLESSCRRRINGHMCFVHPLHIRSKIQPTTSACMSTMKDGIKTSSNEKDRQSLEDGDTQFIPPWSMPSNKPNSKAFARFRQHVNPLSRRYQMRTDLPDDWPKCDFTNLNQPLYLDIGCGKGGFLLELVGRRHGGVPGQSPGEDAYRAVARSMEDSTSQWLPNEMNYLGLEIRPGVSQYAQARVEKRGLSGKLSFIGCNANVDLDRLLTLYQESTEPTDGDNNLAFVSIQFPDPHFKKAHEKRRVVTAELVRTLAKFMKSGGAVFLQSDIKDALEAMREKFADEDGKLYYDEVESMQDGDAEEENYNMKNPLGIPTEREVSVLTKDLPVFRTIFRRNEVKVA